MNKHDQAFGIIPVIREGDVWQVFLIHDIGSRGDTFWGFPKGHAEAGETPLETAKRELLEETALTVSKVFKEHPIRQQYSFTLGDDEIHKAVTYFIGEVGSTSFTLQEEEVKEAGWFSFEEARQKISYDSAKAILDQAVQQLDSL